MPLDDEQRDEIKALIAVSRKRPVNFGLCLGKKPETTAMIAHRMKQPEVLGREAKKASDTAMMTFGTMETKGKSLMLTCIQEPPGGIARKAKLFLKEVGLKMSVQVLDAKGNVLDSDIDDEDQDDEAEAQDTGEEVVDPLRAEWEKMEALLGPKVAAAASSGKGDPSRLRAAWALAVENAGEEDFAGALRIARRLMELVEVKEVVAPKVDPAAAKWAEEAPVIGGLVEGALQRGTGDVGKIRAVWAFAQEKAEAGDFATALKSLTPLKGLIDAGATAEPDAKGNVAATKETLEKAQGLRDQLSGLTAQIKLAQQMFPEREQEIAGLVKTVASASTTGDIDGAAKALATIRDIAKAAAERQKELDASREFLARRLETFKTLKVTAESRLGGTLPKSLTDEFATAEKTLDVKTDNDPSKIDGAIETSDDSLEKIETELNRLASERAFWLSSSGLFDARFKRLEAHSEKAVPAVAAKIEAVRVDFEKAKDLAAKHDYDAALLALPAVADLCSGAENLADDCAHYTAILADRENRVGALLNPSGHVDVTKLIDDAKKVLEDAKKLGTATVPDYTGAVSALTPLAQTCIDVAWISGRAQEYATRRTGINDLINALDTFNDVDATKALITPLRTAYTDSDYATTKDFVKSVTLLDKCGSMINTATVAAIAYNESSTESSNAAVKLNGLSSHAGFQGILTEHGKLVADWNFAKSKRTAGEYLTAKTVCLKVIADCAELQKKAEAYEKYLVAKKAVDDEKDGWDTNWVAFVAEFTAQVQKFENLAGQKVAAKDYAGATTDMKQALEYAEWATEQISRQDTFGNDVGTANAAADNADSDYDAAEREFGKLKTATESADTGNHYTKEIADAEARVGVARIYADAVIPDLPAAITELKGAIQDIHNTFYAVNRRAIYDRLLQDATNSYNTLKATARGDALSAEVAIIDKAFLDAGTAIGNKNFNGAQAQLATATATILKAEAKAKHYDDYTALKNGDIGVIWGKIDKLATDQSMATEKAQFLTYYNEALNLATQKKFDEALARLKVTLKYGETIEKMVDDYIAAKEREKEWVTDILYLADGRPIVDDIRLEVVKMRDRLNEMFTKRQFKQAANYAREIAIKLYKADELYKDSETFTVERGKAVTAIDDLKKVDCDAVKVAIKTVEDALVAADNEATDKLFKNAIATVKTIPGLTVEPLKTGKAFADYTASHKTASDAIEALRSDHGKLPSVALDLRALDGRLKAAETAAASGKYAAAKLLADALPAAVQAARDRGAAQAGLETTAADLAKADPNDRTGIEDQIRGVRATLTKLDTHPGAGSIAAARKTITQDLADAIKVLATDVPAARKALAKAAAGAVAAQAEADQWSRLDADVKEAVARSGQARTDFTAPPAVVRRLDDLDKLLGLARAGTDRGEFQTAMGQLLSATTTLAEAEARGAEHKVYAAERAKVEPEVDALAKHKRRYSVAEEIAEAQDKLATAADAAGAENHAASMTALAEAQDFCETGEIKADMHANEELDDTKVKALLAKKGGADKLDKIIASLDPQTQKKACKLALELRFDMKLQEFTDTAGTTEETADDIPAPNVMRLYDVMKALPDKHTKDNPSVKLVMRIGDVSGTSSFNPGTKDIKLRVGRGTDKVEREIGQAWQLGPVDSKCTPVDDVPPQKFSWTTLHEIGHAVDDKLGYMDKNQSKGTHGSWKAHGSDVKEIAEKVATKFKYDADHIEAYLADPAGAYIAPAPKGTTKQEDWDRARAEAFAWCDSVRFGKAIWYSASETSRLKLDDGRVYQEAYANDWVSYDFAARAQGVAGYQFRAPGEWFAELYAAFHTKKMNPSHPARTWLETL